jgi:DNA-binding NarL/FixJ family response regulator
VTRILLIDDHSLFREAVARMLASQPDFEVAGECATVAEGVEIVKQTPVDVVLLDINLGLQQGGAFPILAREQGFQGKILVVTAGVSKFEATRLMERGCSGIILKHERPDLLIEAIRRTASEEKGALREPDVPISQLPAGAPQTPPNLTRRERQVLRGIFAGQTNKEIANDLNVSEPLVKSVVQQLFMKTGVRTRSALVRIAIERYWKEIEEAAESEAT